MNTSSNLTDNSSSLLCADFSRCPIRTVCYVLYCFFGVIAIILNNIIIFGILLNLRLRRKYVLQIGLAGGDLLLGLANLTAGVRRLAMIGEGTFNVIVTRLDCAKRVYTPLFILGTNIPALMDLLISIDRLVAVAAPLRYHKARKMKIWIAQTTVVYTFCLGSMAFVFYAAAQVFTRRRVYFT